MSQCVGGGGDQVLLRAKSITMRGHVNECMVDVVCLLDTAAGATAAD